MKKKFQGTGVALVTPFHKYGAIDFSSIEKIIEHTIVNGADYMVVLGTTGESPTLSKDEKQAVSDFVIDTVNGRVPIVQGVGGNNTQEIVNSIKSASFDGIDAILSVCPYYNKPKQKGIYYHYKTIASASPVPVILYNVPSRSGVNISAETTLQLAKGLKNIIAIKEASGDLVQIMRILKDKPDDFLVISGDDALTLPLMSLGVDGVISVVANGFPAEFSAMVNYCLKGKFEEAAKIHFQLIDIINALFEDGSPGGIKAALQILELCENNLRLPVVKVNKSLYLQLTHLISEFQSKKKNV
jgi:4-hydroxy-tetrahydrodipicolinate synthase